MTWGTEASLNLFNLIFVEVSSGERFTLHTEDRNHLSFLKVLSSGNCETVLSPNNLTGHRLQPVLVTRQEKEADQEFKEQLDNFIPALYTQFVRVIRHHFHPCFLLSV